MALSFLTNVLLFKLIELCKGWLCGKGLSSGFDW